MSQSKELKERLSKLRSEIVTKILKSEVYYSDLPKDLDAIKSINSMLLEGKRSSGIAIWVIVIFLIVLILFSFLRFHHVSRTYSIGITIECSSFQFEVAEASNFINESTALNGTKIRLYGISSLTNHIDGFHLSDNSGIKSNFLGKTSLTNLDFKTKGEINTELDRGEISFQSFNSLEGVVSYDTLSFFRSNQNNKFESNRKGSFKFSRRELETKFEIFIDGLKSEIKYNTLIPVSSLRFDRKTYPFMDNIEKKISSIKSGKVSLYDTDQIMELNSSRRIDLRNLKGVVYEMIIDPIKDSIFIKFSGEVSQIIDLETGNNLTPTLLQYFIRNNFWIALISGAIFILTTLWTIVEKIINT